MHDAGAATWLLAAAAFAFFGMAWLALAMPVHAQQAWGAPPAPRQRTVLRLLGASALMLALGCCLVGDHATMAVLVWAMLLALSSVATALVLAGRPRALRALAPWVGRQRCRAARRP